MSAARRLALVVCLLHQAQVRARDEVATMFCKRMAAIYWLGWHRHFGPASGADPKLRDALGRYVLLVFCYGANLGPAQLARHMRDRVSPHELSLANKHATAAKLQAASTDVINAFAQLDLPRVWGDGSRLLPVDR